MNEIQFLKKIVEIPSVSGNETELARFLSRQLNEWGIVSHIDEVGNVIGIAGCGDTTIILTSHMDTVDGYIPVRIENGKLYGRGSVDAKSGLAAFAWVMRNFINDKKLRLVFIGVVDEERSSKGAKHIISKYSPDFVINGEPSGWDSITIGYRGYLGFNCFVENEVIHPSAQDCAFLKINDFINKIMEYIGRNKVSFNVPNLEIRNVYADLYKANMILALRFPPDFDVIGFKKFIEYNRGPIKVEWTIDIPAFVSDKNNLLVRSLVDSIREEGGIPTYKKKTGNSDMNIFSVWNCPIVSYAAGDSKLDHTANEHLDLEEFRKSIRILNRAIINISRNTTHNMISCKKDK